MEKVSRQAQAHQRWICMFQESIGIHLTVSAPETPLRGFCWSHSAALFKSWERESGSVASQEKKRWRNSCGKLGNVSDFSRIRITSATKTLSRKYDADAVSSPTCSRLRVYTATVFRAASPRARTYSLWFQGIGSTRVFARRCGLYLAST